MKVLSQVQSIYAYLQILGFDIFSIPVKCMQTHISGLFYTGCFLLFLFLAKENTKDLKPWGQRKPRIQPLMHGKQERLWLAQHGLNWFDRWNHILLNSFQLHSCHSLHSWSIPGVNGIEDRLEGRVLGTTEYIPFYQQTHFQCTQKRVTIPEYFMISPFGRLLNMFN